MISLISPMAPNSTMDSLVLDRVVAIDLFNVGVLIIVIAILSSLILLAVVDYLKHNKL